MRWVIAAVLGILSGGALAFDNGQYGDVPPEIQNWYKSIKSPSGVPCCDISDGHKTAYRVDTQGHFQVPIVGTNCEDGWCDVPPSSVVYSAGNPENSAIVWYVLGATYPHGVHVRCFVPNGGV